MSQRHDLCVLRDEERCAVWTVCRCQGHGTRETMKQFASFAEAADYALVERDRVRAVPAVQSKVHFPDDCPCPTGLDQCIPV